MILDKEVEMVTATGLDLECVRPGPGQPIKMFATGFAADTTLTLTTGVDAATAEGATIPCTTATTGPDGSVEFELPSSTLQFVACAFTVGSIHVTLCGNQTNL